MATKASQGAARLMLTPAVGLLFIWMIVPLAMTLWFSFQRYNLLDPTVGGFAGLDNYEFLVTDPDFWAALVNTLVLFAGFGVLSLALAGRPHREGLPQGQLANVEPAKGEQCAEGCHFTCEPDREVEGGNQNARRPAQSRFRPPSSIHPRIWISPGGAPR